MSKQLGKMLIERNLITEEQLSKGLVEHKKSGEFLGTTLVNLGFISENILLRVLSDKFRMESISLEKNNPKEGVIDKVPVKFVRHYNFMPIGLKNNILKIAIANPYFMSPLDDIKLHLGYDVETVLASEADISSAIKKYYGVGAGTVDKLNIQNQDEKKEIESAAAEVTQDIEDSTDDASVIQLVHQILNDAVKQKATDIHIETFNKELAIRYRIDGILYHTKVPEDIKYLYSAIVSRIKIMSGLDIIEKRIPQDGRAKVKMGGEEWELRVSILPTMHGENIVIRVLPLKMIFGMSKLDLSPARVEIFESLIAKPHGIIFITGPTGSGKTTTLYSLLSKINTSEKKIITIEDPVEYELKGISQVQVLPKVNLTFAAALRSILRHDPDVLMVGEVRDHETAEITIRTALTGHLVFSTLHTNDAATGIARLIDMGTEPYLVASSIEALIAQRLIRTICQNCKEIVKSNSKFIEELYKYKGKKVDLYKGKGCKSCRNTGYTGRVAIYEFLLISDPIRELMINKASSAEIKEKAISLGMTSLKQDGWDKVTEGITTIEEVLRVS